MLSTYPRSLVLLSVRIPPHLKLFWNLHVRQHPLMIYQCLAEKYRKLSSRSWKAVRIFSPLYVQAPVFHHSAPPFQRATLHCYSRWKDFLKKLLSLWPSLSPGICFFLSLCLSLSPHSYSLLVLTFIKLAQPPVGGAEAVSLHHLWCPFLSSCLPAAHSRGLPSTRRWASIQLTRWAATLYIVHMGPN